MSNEVNRLTVRDLEELEKKSQIDLEMSKEELERKQIENDKLKSEWKSCCFTCNADAIKYIVQMGFLGGVVLFSLIQLFLGAEPQVLWVSLLSSALGIAVPSPTWKNNH